MKTQRQPTNRAQRRSHFRVGTVALDPAKILRLMANRGLSKFSLAAAAEIERNTLNRALNRDGVSPQTAKAIADALEVIVEQLLPGDTATGKEHRFQLPPTNEWEPVEQPGPWLTASNGLQFRVCRMQHRELPEWTGRGKFYDLLGVPTDEQTKHNEYLLRHARVTNQIEDSPHIAKSLSVNPISNQTAWWVIDQWIGATTLADRLGSDSAWSREALPRLMREIALGLKALHQAGIVFRELAPSHVLLAESDGRVVLTDFELAKLLNGRPTVSATWPDDPYRAPEIDSGAATIAADLFSWARVLIRASTGELPAAVDDTTTLTSARIPLAVRRVVASCLSLNATQRPQSIDDLLDALSNWK